MGIVAAVAVLLAWMRPAPPAPRYVLDRLPLRMQRLRPGMTERRVWRELGLAGYRIQPMMGAGGDHFWWSYSLGPRYTLVLTSDVTVKPSRLVEARLYCPRGLIDTTDLAMQRTRPTGAVPENAEGRSAGPVR